MKHQLAVLKTLDNVKLVSDNHIMKYCIISHPHWKQGKSGYKAFIKAMKDTIKQSSGYTFMVNGYCNFKGIQLLYLIQKHLNKMNEVDETKLKFYDELSNYSLTACKKESKLFLFKFYKNLYLRINPVNLYIYINDVSFLNEFNLTKIKKDLYLLNINPIDIEKLLK